MQFFGAESAAFLTNLLKGESVYLVFERPEATDRYGRLLAHAYRAPDGLWVNLELVRQGYAQVYSGEAFDDIDLFLKYQTRARESGKGLWDGDAKADWERTTPPAIRPSTSAPVRPAEAPQRETRPEPASVTVYAPRTGAKYHRGSCSYLNKSKIPIALDEARRRYSPCSRCNPPN